MEQHQGLRQILSRALDETTASLRRQGPTLDELAQFVRELASRFRGHLAYEERYLLPVLLRVDSWGSERVEDLLAEHGRQRAEVETLIEGIESDWDVERLALALRSLAADLLLDMAEEERGCLRAELLGDEMLMVETRCE